MDRWLVDGMNVIGSRPDGWWRDRDAAVVALVRRLAGWASTETDEAAEVTVVFDGDRPPPLDEAQDTGDGAAVGAVGAVASVFVVFAGRGRSADDEIVRRVAADPDPGSLQVVTSDAGLAARVRAAGASVIGAGGFRRRLDPYWR
jgi:predicted RNA-binding protein with PIN domain